MTTRPAADHFRHEALLYSNQSEFLAGTVAFIQEGIAGDEAILVVVSAEKISLLRAVLGSDANAVQFADMAVVGANPALIIPAWRDFADTCRRQGRRMRGIGEPIFAARRRSEMLECQRHEALLNVAFDQGDPWRLLCPYDISNLGPAVIHEARRSHPFVTDASSGDEPVPHGSGPPAPYDAPLAPPPTSMRVLPFTVDKLADVRAMVRDEAAAAGLGPERASAIVLAANEVATNSIRFGGELAVARVWMDEEALVCEFTDQGYIERPLVDRTRPEKEVKSSRGLWLANHLCDLVQISSRPGATSVRLHMWLAQKQQAIA